MAFVHTGNPNNPQIPSWAPDTAEHTHTLVIGKTASVQTDFDKELIKTLSSALLDDMVAGILQQVARI